MHGSVFMLVEFLTRLTLVCAGVGQLDCGLGLRCGKLVYFSTESLEGKKGFGSRDETSQKTTYVRTICPRGQGPRRVTLDGREFGRVM